MVDHIGRVNEMKLRLWMAVRLAPVPPAAESWHLRSTELNTSVDSVEARTYQYYLGLSCIGSL